MKIGSTVEAGSFLVPAYQRMSDSIRWTVRATKSEALVEKGGNKSIGSFLLLRMEGHHLFCTNEKRGEKAGSRRRRESGLPAKAKLAHCTDLLHILLFNSIPLPHYFVPLHHLRKAPNPRRIAPRLHLHLLPHHIRKTPRPTSLGHSLTTLSTVRRCTSSEFNPALSKTVAKWIMAVT